MKRLLTLALAFLLTFSLAACGGGGGGGTSQTPGNADPPEGYDAEYNIYVNGSDDWTPFEDGSGVTFENIKTDVISISDDGKTVTFTGFAVGEADITAIYGDKTAKALVKVVNRSENTGNVKFAGHYQYMLPTDNFHIAYTEQYGDKYDYAKIGAEEALIDEAAEWQHFYNISTDTFYSVCDGQWTDDGYADAFTAENMVPLDFFEDDIASKLRGLGFGDEKLAEYYVGTEEYLGIDCWVFDTKGFNGIYAKYWVDPSNGLTLKKVGTLEDVTVAVTIYDLNYKEWDAYFLPN